MKDPTGELLTIFASTLASVAYNGKTWHVYTEQPPKGKRNYIYLSEITFLENGAQDVIISECSLMIEVSTIKNKHCKTIANALSNSILVAVEGKILSMTNFTFVVKNDATNVNQGKEEQGTNYIKQILLNFSVQEK